MIVQSLLYFSFRQCARWRRPRYAAWLLLLATRTIIKHKGQSGNSRRVLVLARAGFSEDVEGSFHETHDFEVMSWPSFAIKALAEPILSPALDHNYYLTDDPKIEATKLAYRDFLGNVWKHFSALMPVDVVVTGNFSYCAEREFAAALENAGTAFVAIHKENVRPPKRVEYWRFLYKERRGPFNGRKVLVYNQIERDLQIACGIASPDKIVVTGMPRLDRIHRWRRENAGANGSITRPQVLFFAFARHEKLTAIQRKPSANFAGNMEDMQGDWGKISWTELGESTHRAMVTLAIRRPDIDVIVKTKGQRRKKDDILRMLRSTGLELPPNLKTVTGGDPFNLMIESRAVVGFNTTGLLEAIAAGKPVIVPWFGEAQIPGMRDNIIDLNDSVLYARSPDDLIDLVCRYVDSPLKVPAELSETASNVLEYWVGNADCAAGNRVQQALLAEMQIPTASSHLTGL